MRNFLTLVAILLLAACNGTNEVKGKIYERKEVGDNKLLIKYKYQFDGKEYNDSATINNVVLDGDTITLQVDKSTPGKFTPKLPNSK